MQILVFAFYTLVGYIANHFVSQPKGKINKKLPTVKFKFLQFSPHIKIYLGKGRVIHIHHWFSFSVILVVSVYTGGLFDSFAANGFLLGGIAQGLTYKDWKSIFKKEI